MLHDALAELLNAVVTNHRDVMVTFAVVAERGHQRYQVPIVKPLEVRKTREGHWVLVGYNLRRLPDSVSEPVSSRDLIRSYRIDRIVPHTLQFLHPSLPPDLIAHATGTGTDGEHDGHADGEPHG